MLIYFTTLFEGRENMLLPAHAAIGGLIGQSIMSGWPGLLVGTISASLSDFEIFFAKSYVRQFIKYGKVINRNQTEIRIGNILHSLFLGLLIILISWLLNWQPIILIIGLSQLSHWLTDAISHRRKCKDYSQAFWPFSGHIKGLYDLITSPKTMILLEGVIPTLIWFVVALGTVLS